MANEFLGWAQDDFGDKVTIQRVADTDYIQIQFWMNSERVEVKDLLADEERISPPSAFMTFMPDELMEFAKILANVAQEQAALREAWDKKEADESLSFNTPSDVHYYFHYCGEVIAKVKDRDETERLIKMLQEHLATYDA